MQYRISEIQKVVLNGKAKKAFKAHKKENDAYVFIGQFFAPRNVKNADLERYITE